MPLQDGDIEVLAISNVTRKAPGNKLVEGKEIRFRVRGLTDEAIFVPMEEYSKAFVEQLILRAAGEIVDLYDRFPIRE